MASSLELPLFCVVWQPRPDTWLLTLVCKATFVLLPGELGPAAQQEPIIAGNSFWNDDPSRSLAQASDLVPSRPKVDVLLVGSAFAPASAPATKVSTRLKIGTIDKRIDVFSDRAVAPTGELVQGPPFVRMPMSYERAAGGLGTDNPVGISADTRDTNGRRILPNVVVNGSDDSPRAQLVPTGYGPLSPAWPSRSRRVRGDALQIAESWMHEPLPASIDLSFFNAAPTDQWLDALSGTPRLRLEGLHREHAVLDCRFPSDHPRVVVTRGAGSEEPQMRADMLLIDTNRALVMVSWRGHVALKEQQEPVSATASLLRPREPTAHEGTAQPQIAGTARRPLPTVAMGAQAFGSALPFQNVARSVERNAALEGLPFADNAGLAAPSSPPTPPAERIMDETTVGPITEVPPAPGTAPPPAGSLPAPPVSAPHHAAPSFGAPAQPAWAQEPMPTSAWRPPPAPEQAPATAPSYPPTAKPPPITSAAMASHAAADRTAASRLAGPASVFQAAEDGLELLWFIPEVTMRVRRVAAWRELLLRLENQPIDAELEEAPLGDDEADSEDRREVFEVLAHATPALFLDIAQAQRRAVRPDGRFAPQLLLLKGEVCFELDELEVLKASVSALSAIDADEALSRELETANRFLAAPGLVASDEVVTTLNERLRRAFLEGTHNVGGDYLATQVERALISRRAFQTRDVFGAPHLRGVFRFAGSTDGIPTYLPATLSKRLPMFRRLPARLLVEVHFKTDQYESNDVALKAVAIARILRPAG